MFNSIIICSFVPENNKHVIDTAFELAKKFDSEIISLKCIFEDHPIFGLFKTKSDKKKQSELAKKTQLALDEIKDLAKNSSISIKTESVFVDSLSEYVSTYVDKNNFDLLVVDSSLPLDIDVEHHKDIVNRIYQNIKCPVLTLK
jgi:hypothetical protein